MQESNPSVKVHDLYKTFKLPHERHSGLKQAALNLFRKKDKGYELQKVLNDISFEINKGEFFAIVGRNGSGKSTLLKLLAGIYTPDKGLVQVNGSLTPFIELGVGFNPELTGRENVYMNGALLGFDNKKMDAMYDEIVEFAELSQFMDQKLKNYSSGMQVRLAFSIAIRARSDILLLDEVLAVGDSAFQQKCLDYFNKLKEEKRTIILVTHDMGTVKRFCTRALYLKQGKIVTIGDPGEIADMYLVDNMESLRTLGKDDEPEALYGLRIDATKEDDHHIEITHYYESKTEEEVYVGVSILRDGVSVAEISTPKTTILKGKGKITYAISKEMFNPGVYEFTAVLCAAKGRNLLTVSANRVMFVVSGSDTNRGGALKLPLTWSKPSTR